MPTVGLERVLRRRFVSVTNIVVFGQAAVRVVGLVLFWPWPPSASMPTVGLERVLRHRFVSVTNILNAPKEANYVRKEPFLSEQAVSAAGAMYPKRSFSSLDLAADARAARARRSALRRQAQPSNKEDQKVAVSAASAMSLKDTSLPPSPPAPSIDGRTLFNLETLLIATKMKAEAEAQEAQNVTTMKTEAEVSTEGLATLAQLLADETTADKTTTADDSGDGSGTRTGPMTNSWGPVIIEGWPGVPETTEEGYTSSSSQPDSEATTEEGYTSSSSQPDSEATLVLPTREKKRQAIVEKHFDVSWPDLDYDARACLFHYLVDHGKVDGGTGVPETTEEGYTSSASRPDSEGDAGWVAMLE